VELLLVVDFLAHSFTLKHGQEGHVKCFKFNIVSKCPSDFLCITQHNDLPLNFHLIECMK